MRYVLLAIIAAAALGAAERESLTLRDGRTLVGVYDEVAGTIALDGKIHAVLPVKADQIQAREPAPAEVVVATTGKPEPSTTQPKEAAAMMPRASLAAEIAKAQRDAQAAKMEASLSFGVPANGRPMDPAIKKAWDQATATSDRYDRLLAQGRAEVLGKFAAEYDADQKRIEELNAQIASVKKHRDAIPETWSKSVHLHPVTMKIGDDPTRSEQGRAERAAHYNEVVTRDPSRVFAHVDDLLVVLEFGSGGP